MGRLFGTDGIRGVANVDLTPELAFKIGRAGAYVLTGHGEHKAKIIVGRDTRISGDMLEAALIAGICSVGADAIVAGIVPTPAIAYLTRLHEADAGVVISASHNPVEYNGIKYFNSVGYKLKDEIEDEIEAYIFGEKEFSNIPSGVHIGCKYNLDSALTDYTDFIKSTVQLRFDGMKIAIDCANGAAFESAPLVLAELGANLEISNNTPDGTNINKHCGSTHVDKLSAFVKRVKADVGLAFDGDADRLIAVDENGAVIDGDKIMAVCAHSLKAKNRLSKDTLVATVMSNLGLFLMCEKTGITAKQTKVGDRYVLEEMINGGYNLGGEQSGHIIFLDYNTTGDGLLSAVQFLSILKESGKPASEIASIVDILPQVLVNAKVQNRYKTEFMNDPNIKSVIEDISNKYKGSGRVLIRPSGTEPLVRVMIEGQDYTDMKLEAERLAKLLEARYA